MRGGEAPYLFPLTLHVFRHLSLFPIRPGESQGFRLHFGQHDKTAAGRAGGSVSVRDTGTWTRQHRFSWSKGRLAAAASSSSSSLPLLHASPYSAAAGATSGPSRRQAPPGARGWLSGGAVVGLQAAGAERRGGGGRPGVPGRKEEPRSPQLRLGLSAAAARRPDPCGAAQCRGALCRCWCCWTGFPPPSPSSLPPSSSFSSLSFPRHKCGGAESGPLTPGPRGGAPGARGLQGAGGSGKGGHNTTLATNKAEAG